MPRDSSGNYLLPAGNPVVSGTVIESTWANTTMDDIQTALTDSLDRQGRGGMLAPFRFADGTLGQPALSWTQETNTGFYRAGFQDMRAVVSGVETTRWVDDGAGGATFQIFEDSSGLWKDAAHENSAIRFGDGTIDEPSISWFDEVTDGWYRAGDGDQRYVQDVAATQTDLFRFKDGATELLHSPYVSGTPTWLSAIGTQLEVEPTDASPDDAVASVGYVKGKATLIAQGVGDGNSDTLLGDGIGVQSWDNTNIGRYTLTLSTVPSNTNNVVVSLTAIESVDIDIFCNVQAVSGSGQAINIRAFDGSSLTSPDAIMFTVWDTGG